MWQSPNQRVRAIANARKRQRERLMNPYHFRRVEAAVKLLGTPAGAPATLPVRVVLNDLSPKGTGLFCTEQVLADTELEITLKSPKELTLKGKVVACQEYYNDSHILSEKTYRYRLGIRFVFENPEQEKALQEFCDDLNKNHLYGTKAA